MHRALLTRADVPLVVIEGLKKHDAVVSHLAPEHPLCPVGLIGTYRWMRDRQPLPDWQAITLQDRQVLLVYDSDVITTPEVGQARLALAMFLKGAGAQVHHIDLPALPGGKCGADDYLVAGHTLDDLLRLAQETFPRPRSRHSDVGPHVESQSAPPLNFIVEELLPAGCTLLTGKSKDGKSMMAYNLAVAVASGGKALGTYTTMPGSVWYLALEDGERRRQQRLALQEPQMSSARRRAGPPRLHPLGSPPPGCRARGGHPGLDHQHTGCTPHYY